ncbi:MAG: epimerase, partial [Gammaproteobacteria bacterium HGW-Gammaproteobacteria-7]
MTGADGFLAGFIISALRERGWRVLRGTRASRAVGEDARHCDFERLPSPRHWMPKLAGVDAVVNLAGILRQTARRRFDTIHHDAPLALAHACVECGVPRFIQISALGDPTDGAFVTSKHRFDDALLALPIKAVVLRPSVVYSTTGSYGGTSLLRALAAAPGVLALPGDGEWPIQPLAAEDLARIVVRALDSKANGVFEVGG